MTKRQIGGPARVLVGVRLPVQLARRLKAQAARQGTTTQALVERIVTAFLAKSPAGNSPRTRIGET